MGREDESAKVVSRLESIGVIRSEAVKSAMLKVRRDDFVPRGMESLAYSDMPLPIPGGTISAQHMHAILLEELDLGKGDRVLEVGSGSGILLAYIKHIVGSKGRVVGVDVSPEAARFARGNLRKAGLAEKVRIVVGDGYAGLPDEAPFDRIVVSAAVDRMPRAWEDQLKEGGIILAPVGKPGTQELWKFEKRNGRMRGRFVTDVAFVPLTK